MPCGSGSIPARSPQHDLTAGEVVAALQSQNVQVSAGVLGQPPVATPGAFQLNVETLGRLADPAQFDDIIVETDAAGRVTRIRDIGRVELGAQDYGANGYLDRLNAVPLLVYQQPGLERAVHRDRIIRRRLKDCRTSFPQGLRYDIVYDTTTFIAQSVHEVLKTILEAVGPRRHRGDRVPADLARLGHSDRCDPDLADRHLRHPRRPWAFR